LERKALTRKVERKNIKEEGKEGRWENLLLLPDTHTPVP
jgi:hypothetical protein